MVLVPKARISQSFLLLGQFESRLGQVVTRSAAYFLYKTASLICSSPSHTRLKVHDTGDSSGLRSTIYSQRTAFYSSL